LLKVIVNWPFEPTLTDDFLVMTAAASNAIARSSRMTVTTRMPEKVRAMLRRVVAELPEAKRKVEVVLGDYREAPDIEATWFVDAPYQRTREGWWSQGMGYGPGCTSADLDHGELAAWCRSRRGQVIVCEQAGASWLPFRPLSGSRCSNGRRRMEVVWTDDASARLATESRDGVRNARRCRHHACGRPLGPSVRADAAYCSARCRQRERRARLALLAPPSAPRCRCGTLIQGRRSVAAFCSNRCRQAAYRARRAAALLHALEGPIVGSTSTITGT
jgi:hypothetical protein